VSSLLLTLLQALNEFDLRATDWRKKLESQRGAVLAFETKNNLAKIAKWTMCALLAGADMVKLGYVSRAGPKDNSNHVILGTQVRGYLFDFLCVVGLSANQFSM
jgi:translation initiation factor 3 subunit D